MTMLQLVLKKPGVSHALNFHCNLSIPSHSWDNLFVLYYLLKGIVPENVLLIYSPSGQDHPRWTWLFTS